MTPEKTRLEFHSYGVECPFCHGKRCSSKCVLFYKHQDYGYCGLSAKIFGEGENHRQTGYFYEAPVHQYGNY